MRSLPRLVLLAALLAGLQLPAAETIWLEAEHFGGIKGYCWPMARGEGARFEAMRSTDGHWGLSGPGWTTEWMQGGESGFLSIACGAGDDRAEARYLLVGLPVAGTYYLWVRYRDNREQTERFQVRIQQSNQTPHTFTFGERPVVEEDNAMKLYFDGAFGWDCATVDLDTRAGTITLLSAFPEPGCRQIDCLVLTTDAAYRPHIKERPPHPTWQLLDSWRTLPAGGQSLAGRPLPDQMPASWRPRLFDGKFVYLWNTQSVEAGQPAGWLRDGDGRVRFPIGLRPGQPEFDAFLKLYADRDDVPIYSDPRVMPCLTGASPDVFGTANPTPLQQTVRDRFAAWLDAHPEKLFGNLLNYQPNKPLDPAGRDLFLKKYLSRYVGGISGENLGYFAMNPKDLEPYSKLTDRRAYVEAMGAYFMKQNQAKYAACYGDAVGQLGNPYRFTIPCLSASGTAFFNLCYDWGAQTVGHEAYAGTAGMHALRLAFLRGAARQHGGRTAVYRSCNFGDSATIFSELSSYTKPSNIYDNYYDVFSGAGMTWYKFDIWYQYMAGAALFYHEQGFDEFWLPGGTSAAGKWPLQLSPKGKLVDRFLRLTADDQHFDRGTPVTPVAVLVDYAHGWDPANYVPRLWGHTVPENAHAAVLGTHSTTMAGLFNVLYHPIVTNSQQPITALSENFPHGVFGDIFDVIYAYPDVKKWTTIDTYPVVIVGGCIALTQAEGERLRQYLEHGGTLLVCPIQLDGPGAASLNLPRLTAHAPEADSYALDGAPRPSQRFDYFPLGDGFVPLIRTGKEVIAGYRAYPGGGKLVYLSVPLGLGIDRQPVPMLAELVRQLTTGLMPVAVEGDVEWSLNRNATGWMLTLINSDGQLKPQHGMFPTDYTRNRTVRVVARVPIASAVDRLQPTDAFTVEANAFTVTVPAGGIRIIEIR